MIQHIKLFIEQLAFNIQLQGRLNHLLILTHFQLMFLNSFLGILYKLDAHTLRLYILCLLIIHHPCKLSMKIFQFLRVFYFLLRIIGPSSDIKQKKKKLMSKLKLIGNKVTQFFFYLCHCMLLMALIHSRKYCN